MSRNYIVTAVTCLLVAGMAMTAQAGIVQSNTSSGNWNTTTSWTPTRVPTASDTAVIRNGHTITVAAAPTNPTIARLQVDVGGKLSYTSNTAYNLAVTNQFVCNGVCSIPSTGAGNWVVGDSIAIGTGARMFVTGTVLQTSGHFVNNGTFRRRGAGATTVSGAFVNNSIFSDSIDAPLNFNGSFFSNGSNREFGDGGATVTFGGSANESICGSAPPTFYKLLVNKSGGTEVKQNCAVTLANVAAALTVTQGVLNTNGQDLNANAGTSATVTGAAGGKLRVTGSAGTVSIRALDQNGTLGDFVVAGSTVNIWGQHTINYATNAVRCSVLGGTLTYHLVGTTTSSALYFPTMSTANPGGFFADGGTVVFDSSNIYAGRDARFVANSPAVVRFEGAAGTVAGQQYVYFASSASSVNSQWSFGDLKLEKTGANANVIFTYTSSSYSLSANVTASSVTINTGNRLYLRNYFASASYGYEFGSVTNWGTFIDTCAASSAGFLTVLDDFTNNSGATATWSRTSPRQVGGNLMNAGTMTLSGSTTLGVTGILSNSGTMTFSTNPTSFSVGSMTQSGSALSLSVSGPVTVAGNLNNTTSLTMSGTSTFALGSVTNTGTAMTLSSSGAMTVAGNLSNSTSMTISNANPLSVGSLTNTGSTMNLSASCPVTVTGNLNNSGSMTVSGPTAFTVGSLTNSGTMALTAAIRYVVNGDLNNNAGGKLLRTTSSNVRRLYVAGSLVNNDSIYAFGYSTTANVSDTILGSVTNNKKMVYNYQSLYVGEDFANTAGAVFTRLTYYNASYCGWLVFDGDFSNASTATFNNVSSSSVVPLYFGGNLTNDQAGVVWGGANSVTFQNSNAAVLGGSAPPTFYTMYVNKPGGSLTLGCDLAVTSSTGLTVSAGGLLIGQRTLTLGTSTTAGKLDVVGSGAAVSIVGTAFANGKVTAASSNSLYYYTFTVRSSAEIGAKYATFERMGTDGVYVQSTTTIDPANTFSYCTFDHAGATSGPMLRVENTQTFQIDAVTFNASYGNNIRKASTSSGRITVNGIAGGGGSWWGAGRESDNYSLIDWIAQRDVGCTHITSPPSIVDSSTVVTPSCSLYNWGNQAESYNVRMRIGTTYNAVASVTDHQPGTRKYLEFTGQTWLALQRGANTVRCSTELAGDWDPSFDKTTKNITVAVTDLGPNSFSVPALNGTYDPGTVVNPQAVWRNFGTAISNYWAFLLVSDPTTDVEVYRESVYVTNHSGGTNRTVTGFPSMQINPKGIWTMRCSTGCAAELPPYYGNNQMTGTFICQKTDVGVASITVPQGSYRRDTMIAPVVTWKNYGEAAANFRTYVFLSDPTVDVRVYAESIYVTALPPAAETTLRYFPPRQLNMAGTWSVRCSTRYVDDHDPTNDVMDGQFRVEYYDVVASSVTVPKDTYALNAVITPVASWKNNSTVGASFEAWISLSDPTDDGRVYHQKVNVAGLAPAAETTLTAFPGHTLTRGGEWAVRCSTGYGPDQNPGNNHFDEPFYVRTKDVAARAIVAPKGHYGPGTSVTPTARWKNYGLEPANFEAWMILSDPSEDGRVYYQKIDVVGLEPGADTTLSSFPGHVVNTVGTWAVRCSTYLAGDLVPGNDLIDETFTVGTHDVGVEAILAPNGEVQRGTTVYPKVRLHNYGNLPASFNLRFTIDDGAEVGDVLVYDRTEPVTVPVGADLDHTFAVGYVANTPGYFTTHAEHDLRNDVRPENDQLDDDFDVALYDVAAVAIIVPKTHYAQGTVVTPSATWRNNGTGAASFEAWMIMSDPSDDDGRVYYQKRNVTALGPGASTTVSSFPTHALGAVGTWAVRCSTGYGPDQNPGNNVIDETFTVGTYDVGVEAIIAPNGEISQGTTVYPRVRLRNYGNLSASFDLRFTIDDGVEGDAVVYDQTERLSVPAGAVTEHQFAVGYLAAELGHYTTHAEHNLAYDVNPANDQRDDDFDVLPGALHDVGATAIIVPAAEVGQNARVYPRVTVQNFGNRTESFNVRVRISTAADGEVWNQAEPVTGLGIGETRDFQFTTYYWTATPVGSYQVRCSTELVGDFENGNDRTEKGFEVIFMPVHDVGATAVLVPAAAVELNSAVYPMVTVVNFGNQVEDFDVRVRISTVEDGEVWNEAEPLTGLGVGESRNFQFTTCYWTASPLGSYTVRCTTELAGDAGPENDAFEKGFSVVEEVGCDVGAVRIVSPPAYVETSAVVVPEGVWKNFATTPATFQAYFMLFDPLGTMAYERESTIVDLYPDEELAVQFEAFNVGTAEGNWRARCSTWAPGDPNPENDVWVRSFMVGSLPPWPYGWDEVEPMPTGTGKAVKDGGWLALGPSQGSGVRGQGSGSGPRHPIPDSRSLGSVFYVAKGNKTTDFYRYYPGEDSWVERQAIPTTEGTKSKPPSKGCVGVSDGGNYVYMTKGNNTLGFWRYDVAADKWDSMPGVPLGPGNKKVKGGTDMVYVPASGPDDTGWVYLLKGYKTEFYRFNTRTGTWDLPLPEVPYGGGKQKYDKGSFLVYDGSRYLYAHQAKYFDKLAPVKYHYMFRYDLGTGRWTDTLKGMPLLGWHGGKPGKSKKSKDGAAGDWFAENMYALKGGNTQQFYRYFPDGDSWQELDTVPGFGVTGKKKYVKAGADLASYGGGVFFTLKGNKTFEVWRYRLSPLQVSGHRSQPASGAMGDKFEVRASKFDVVPNPVATGFATLRFSLPKAGPATVTVFDIAGRSLLRQSAICNLQSAIVLDLREVPAGVYLVRLDADGYSASQKLVVQR